MPHFKKENQIRVEVFEGVTRITLACGKDILLARFEYKKGARVPPHAHAYEQVTHVLKGKQRIIILYEDKKEDFVVEEGDSYVVPANHEHEQITLEESVTIDSWSLAI